jgi:hypothetical protein
MGALLQNPKAQINYHKYNIKARGKKSYFIKLKRPFIIIAAFNQQRAVQYVN